MKTHSNKEHYFWIIPWVMWFLPSLFFAYQFIVRIIPGLVMPELMSKFQIDATSYGFFASIYYVGYAGFQIPIALLLDRYDPKKVLAVCALLCSLGTIVLVYSDNWTLALISRFLIGIGSTVGFLGSSKMVILWFKPESYSRMMALNCTIGLLGAVYAGKPITEFIKQYGFEQVLLSVAIVGFGLAFLFASIIRNPLKNSVKNSVPKTNFKTEISSICKDLKIILSNRKLIIAAIGNLLMVGALEGFADVWGVSFLMAARDISKGEAARLISAIFLGMVCGGPILAYVSDKFKAIYGVTCTAGLIMGVSFFIIFNMITSLDSTRLYGILFLIGIFCSYQVLVFSIGIRIVSAPVAGIAVAFLNSINMLGGSFFHGTIGRAMDYFWTGTLDNGMKNYSAETYTQALMIIPIAAILGGLCFFLIRKKEIHKKETEIESLTLT